MDDSIEDILTDAREVFCYDRDVRPQDRAHAYLARNRVRRGYDDTAMECVVVDLVRRAHALGDGSEAAANALRQFEAIERVARAGIEALSGGEEEEEDNGERRARHGVQGLQQRHARRARTI